MDYLQISDESIAIAAAVIKNGGLVAFPTETVYGLGADAFNTAALVKVFAVKKRPFFDPLIIHIAAAGSLEKIADLSALSLDTQEKIKLLTETFWPGPLTLILPKQKTVPDLATSGLPAVAVRFPAHTAAQRLIELSTGAVAAPSANLFGYLSPTCAQHVREQLGNEVDIILDGGQTDVGIESTVLDMCQNPPRILRPGGVSQERIEKIIGKTEYCFGEAVPGSDLQTAGLASPGQLKSHYAPRAVLSIHSREEIITLPARLPDKQTAQSGNSGRISFLFFDSRTRNAWLVKQCITGGVSHNGDDCTQPVIKTLSENGNDLEAAANLFKMLHELDESEVCCIYAQLAPQHGLGVAINDRLKKASFH